MKMFFKYKAVIVTVIAVIAVGVVFFLRKADISVPVVGNSGVNAASGNSLPEDTGLIDLNTATEAQLQMLPGVGEALAGRILQYREKIGCFTAKEQLKNVKGIGKSLYRSIEKYICVKSRLPE